MIKNIDVSYYGFNLFKCAFLIGFGLCTGGLIGISILLSFTKIMMILLGV